MTILKVLSIFPLKNYEISSDFPYSKYARTFPYSLFRMSKIVLSNKDIILSLLTPISIFSF